ETGIRTAESWPAIGPGPGLDEDASSLGQIEYTVRELHKYGATDRPFLPFQSLVIPKSCHSERSEESRPFQLWGAAGCSRLGMTRLSESERIRSGPVHCAPEGTYVPIVLFEAPREAVMSVAITHKIQVVTDRRVHRSLQRTPARIRDGPRREARIPVGVVERLGRKII